jgi:4,5-dihydroxyphthalate decarboxylase
VEAEYYRQTKIFPIMHMVVLRRAVYEQDRSLAVRLAQGFHTAKQLAFEAYEEGLSTLPWSQLDLEYARQIFGEDVYPYGIARNLPTLEAATLYSQEQGLTKRRFDLNELFAAETLDIFG